MPVPALAAEDELVPTSVSQFGERPDPRRRHSAGRAPDASCGGALHGRGVRAPPDQAQITRSRVERSSSDVERARTRKP
jgi:hypothetical protein